MAEAESIETGRYRLEEQVGYLMRRAGQRHVALFSSMIGDGLTTTQWAALARLADLEPCSQNQLGRATAMDVATVKGVVDRLARRGLIQSEPDPSDGRRLTLSLTAWGHAVVARNLEAAERISEATLEPLDPAERRIFMALLARMT